MLFTKGKVPYNRKVFVSREFLYKKYVTEQNSFANLKSILGVKSKSSVGHWLHRYNIPIRPTGRNYPETLKRTSLRFTGKGNPMFGKEVSEETKQKIKNALPDTFGKNNSNWQGGIKKSHGYVYIYIPVHPNAVNRYVKRSHLVMEKSLDRFLVSGEVVHHKNEICDDDRIENLQLFETTGQHSSFHCSKRRRNLNV